MTQDAENRVVFLVDDEVAILLLLTKRLEAAGYNVVTFSDGANVLDAIKKNRPDLIIADFSMKNVSGLSLLNIIRNEYVKEPIPFFMLTAHDDKKDVFERAGVTAYIQKPINGAELVSRVDAFFAEDSEDHG